MVDTQNKGYVTQIIGPVVDVTFVNYESDLQIFYDSFERGRTTGSLLDLPSWIAELPVPTLFAMLAIQAIIEIWKLLTDQPIPEGETQ